MCQTNPLRLMFDRPAVDNGMLELFDNSFMNGIALAF
jgi:hypothetical protein